MTIRLAGIIVGLVFTAVLLLWSLVPGAIDFAQNGLPEEADYAAFHEENIEPEGGFSFEGPLGKWDVQQLQRGYKVYKEVCSACHSLKYVAFRNLEQLGYSEAQVRAEAATWQVPFQDPQSGEMEMRPGEPTDQFPPVYYLGQGNPPDLSLITKARPDGSHYVYSLMQGYNEPDPEDLAKSPDFETPPGLYFNEYFHNINIAMPPQLMDGIVTYDDGTEATPEQMSEDVAAFLTWTAEPSLVYRKQMGWYVILFLLFATGLAFLSYKQIWARKKPKK